jgi:hypothetical protein
MKDLERQVFNQLAKTQNNITNLPKQELIGSRTSPLACRRFRPHFQAQQKAPASASPALCIQI